MTFSTGYRQCFLLPHVRHYGAPFCFSRCHSGPRSRKTGNRICFRGGDNFGLPSGVAAECGLKGNDIAASEACANRTLFKNVATTYARIQRFVLLGKLCHKLSEHDAQAIVKNSRSELEEARSTLTDEDKNWAKTWQEAIVVGATKAADVFEAASEEECGRFAQPGGALTKIMSWSGKPQSVDGVLVSPRSTP